jgi:probable H4MPT-linked C1 transfer pathway protein
MPPSVLALDIGGANLKAAHTTGVARTVPFELWKQPAGLAAALRALAESFPTFDALAVTMTGELCDCYPTRRDGVLAILDSVAFVSQWLAKPTFVWRTDGTFADLAAARTEPLACAAANWLALATFAGRFAPQGHAMLLDVGSTTSDLIPLRDGVPIPAGRTDFDRLRAGELVYTGVSRTPVCAVLGESVAAEWFATTLDVYLLLGDIAEDADDRRTADGRPATREHSHARLARMRCADAESFSLEDARGLAQETRNRQLAMLRDAWQRVTHRLPEAPPVAIVAGSGEFLAHRLLDLLGVRAISLAAEIGVAASTAACAHALAHLAREMHEEETR